MCRIRRTQKGDLLLEINANSKESVKEFQGKVEKSIGLQADISARTPEIVIECKDIDEITTKLDISNALNNLLGVTELKESDVLSLRKGYAGTQIATIRLPVEFGNKALEIGKVKIGWAV